MQSATEEQELRFSKRIVPILLVLSLATLVTPSISSLRQEASARTAAATYYVAGLSASGAPLLVPLIGTPPGWIVGLTAVVIAGGVTLYMHHDDYVRSLQENRLTRWQTAQTAMGGVTIDDASEQACRLRATLSGLGGQNMLQYRACVIEAFDQQVFQAAQTTAPVATASGTLVAIGNRPSFDCRPGDRFQDGFVDDLIELFDTATVGADGLSALDASRIDALARQHGLDRHVANHPNGSVRYARNGRVLLTLKCPSQNPGMGPDSYRQRMSLYSPEGTHIDPMSGRCLRANQFGDPNYIAATHRPVTGLENLISRCATSSPHAPTPATTSRPPQPGASVR